MKPEVTDVQRTLEYGQSHDLARQFLPFTLAGIAIGLLLMTSLDGEATERKMIWLGWAVIAVSLGMLGVAIKRRIQPSVPSIVVSPRGILFRDVSATIIPWNEVLEVGIANVSDPRELVSTKVTKLVVSREYYASLTGGAWLQSVIASEGDPSEIYLSYFHSLPFEEFQQAVQNRWNAFSQHSKNRLPPDAAASGVAAPPSAPQRSGTIRRASSFEGLRALTALAHEQTLGRRLVMAASLASIVALLANHIGLWSTAAQVKGRASAAEWRQWQEKFEADSKATADDQRRIEKMWDRKFKCMNEYWELHDRGEYKQDPACMKED